MEDKKKIIIEFTIDEDELAGEQEFREDLLRLGDELALGFCWMPVRFSIGDHEVFFRISPEGAREPGMHVPILNVAYAGLNKLMSAWLFGGPVTWDIAETGRCITFNREGHEIELSTHGFGADTPPITTDFEDLKAAFDRFADNTRNLIISRFPEMLDNPQWEAWLRREEGYVQDT